MIGTTSSITMQSLGKIAECAPAVGAKMWCFFCFLSCSVSGSPCVRGVHSSNKHCVAVYCPISTRFAFFSEGLLEALHSSHFRRQVAPQLSQNCGEKCDIQKIGGKICAHHFVQIAKGFEKILLQQFMAETVDVHLYKTISDDRKCQISYRQSKNGSEIIVRTKSHTVSKFS